MRGNRNRRNKMRNRKQEKLQFLELQPSFKGQLVQSMIIPTNRTKLTTIVTSGIISSNIDLDVGEITNFSTRFAAFDEYRVVKIRMHFECFSATNPGIIRAWVEEKSSSSPSVTTAQTNRGITFPAASVDRTHTMSWRPADPADAAYTAEGSTLTPAYLNIYTNNANFGSSIVATDYLLYWMEFTVQFRGMA